MLTRKVIFSWVIFRSIGFISFSIHLTPRSIVFIRFSSLRSSKYQFGCGYFRKVLVKSMKPIRKTIVLNYRPDMFAQTVHAQSTITFYARTIFDKDWNKAKWGGELKPRWPWHPRVPGDRQTLRQTRGGLKICPGWAVGRSSWFCLWDTMRETMNIYEWNISIIFSMNFLAGLGFGRPGWVVRRSWSCCLWVSMREAMNIYEWNMGIDFSFDGFGTNGS